MYQLQDGRLGGCSDGDSILDPYEPPSRVAIFMVGMQPVQNSSTVAAMISSLAAAATAGASGHVRSPAQALSELLEALATLLPMEVTPATQAQHKVGVSKLRDEIAQANTTKKDTSMTFWAEQFFSCHTYDTYDNNYEKIRYHHRCGGLLLL